MNTRSENTRKLTDGQLESIRKVLEQKREKILNDQDKHLNALHSPDKHHIADLEEMAPNSVDTDALCALMDLSSSTISEIDVALEKVERGTYGLCETCDSPIPPARLEVLPFASLCIDCQRKKERETMAEGA